jgi:hypothetical protein
MWVREMLQTADLSVFDLILIVGVSFMFFERFLRIVSKAQEFLDDNDAPSSE